MHARGLQHQNCGPRQPKSLGPQRQEFLSEWTAFPRVTRLRRRRVYRHDSSNLSAIQIEIYYG